MVREERRVVAAVGHRLGVCSEHSGGAGRPLAKLPTNKFPSLAPPPAIGKAPVEKVRA